MAKINRIIFDIDSTIANTDVAFLKAYEEIHNVKFKDYKVTQWNFGCHITNLTKEDRDEVFKSDNFFNNFNLYPHFKQEFIQLYEDGFSLGFCSQCIPGTIDKKVEWLQNQFRDTDIEYGIYLGINNGKDKSWCFMDENTMFIDDHPENLDSTTAGTKILFNYSGNVREYQKDGINKYEVLKSWLNFSGYVAAINFNEELKELYSLNK